MATKQSKKDLAIFVGLFLVTVVLWNVPYGRVVLYPFTILGTWFHEMAHGLTAMLLGGNFQRLILYPNGSGIAQFSYERIFLGPFGKAMIAGMGPLGPTVIGATFVYASTNKRLARIILLVLIVAIFASIAIWIRPLLGFGFFIMIAIGIALAYIYSRQKPDLTRYTLQFLGLQAFLSLYLSINYLYSAGGVVDSSSFSSDTQVMADNLLLPHWFWATAILALSIYLIYKSFTYAFVKKGKAIKKPDL